ncbi:MAG TPA: hypothetical protein VHX20_19150 [Terracidiphilus sp.]|jgi:hypothetical protein|nr:hypothetical protein [Terracidiphilus sp.]
MTTSCRTFLTALLLAAALVPCRAGQLTVSRDALERTLRQQLFAGPQGLYYLKGGPHTPCSITAQDPRLSFERDRIVVRMKTHARLGRSVGGACIGMTLTLPAEVSFEPNAEGQTIGFRDARLDRISDQREVNFVLAPFLRRQVPSSMKVDAADLLRKALAGSTATSGYRVTLDRLKIHSATLQGNALVVDIDGDIGIR